MARNASVRAVRNPAETIPEGSHSLRTKANNPAHTVIDKDEDELELEKLIFGDDAGFQDALKLESYAEPGSDSIDSTDAENLGASESDQSNDIEAIPDDDLFFIDTGPESIINQQGSHSGSAAKASDEDPPGWIDSEDERLVISLASDTRLRKLRISEGEDLVGGKEYIKRLRQQFERLHPRPAWAVQAEKAHRKKRRRTSESDNSADESDLDNMSIASEDLNTQPLAKLLQSSGSLIKPALTDSTKRALRPDSLDIQRTKDVGGTQPSAITSLSFHPTKPVLLSSGPSGLLTLHHLSPTAQPPNPILHSICLPKHPIHTSTISASGEEIYFSSRRRFFHTWSLTTGAVTRSSHLLTPSALPTTGTQNQNKKTDQASCERLRASPCGRYIALIGTSKKTGTVNILDARTTQWIGQAQVEGRNGVADIAWWRTGDGLTVLSKGGAAIEYSVLERRALARWRDAAVVNPTVIALGGVVRGASAAAHVLGGDRVLAIGLASGIVSVYDRSAWADLDSVPAAPQPLRSLEQLTTPISHVVFADDGQMLVIASRWKRDALRLVHLPSCTVYARWPTSGTPLGRISAVALGPGGHLLAVGNEAGKVRMWEIRG